MPKGDILNSELFRARLNVAPWHGIFSYSEEEEKTNSDVGLGGTSLHAQLRLPVKRAVCNMRLSKKKRKD